MSRKILIIANPVAGLRRSHGLLEACTRRVAAAGGRVETVVTSAPGEATGFAREAADHFDLVAALGGDGTVGQVADGLVGGRAALGILPAGTRNVLAREMHLPRHPLAAASHLVSLPLQRISLGWAAGRHFALCLSAGVDAAVLREGERLSPGKLSLPVHARALWRVLSRRDWPRLRVEVPGLIREGSVAIVSKARTYAAYFRAAPGGGLRDPHLHLSIFRGETRRSLLLGLLAMLGGRHGTLREMETLACDQVRLTPVGAPVPYERDGDSEGFLPLEVRVIPDALDLAAPSAC